MKKVRYFLYGFLVFIVILLAVFYIVPTGKITYKQDLSKKYFNFLGGRGFLHKISPEERLLEDNKIIGDPVYFNFRTSRNFSKVKMTLKYKLSSAVLGNNEYLNIETGVLMDKANWRYNLYPVFNKKMNEVLNEWNIIKNEQTVLAQKDKNYSSLEDFLNQKNFSSTVLYNYNLNYDYILPDYEVDDKIVDVYNLKGSYSFYTYIKNEDLKIDFSFLNEKVSANNQPSIFVYYQNQLIFEDALSIKDSLGNFNLFLSDLPEGVYKVEIKVDDDWLTKKLSSHNSKMVFINKVWLNDLSTGLKIWSNKNNFKIKSFSAQCLSDVKINNETFLVDEIYKQFDFSIEDIKKEALNEISSDSCGLLIETNGLFAFSEDSFFNPIISKLNEESDWNNINTIIANYEPPKQENDYYISEIEMDLHSAVRDKDGYRFLISAPFLKKSNNNEYIELKEINMEFEGSNLINKISSIINKE